MARSTRRIISDGRIAMFARCARISVVAFLWAVFSARGPLSLATEIQKHQGAQSTVNLSNRVGPLVMTYSRPGFDEYDNAIRERKKLLRGRILIDNNTEVSFYEEPKDARYFVNSTIVVKRRGRAAETYDVGDLISHQALSLVHVAFVPARNHETMLVCNYADGFASIQPQGFAVLRFSASEFSLHTLPLTEAGKVVVFRDKPWLAKIWSSLGNYQAAVADTRHYSTQLCRWEKEGYRCETPKQQDGLFSPISITEPGIEIRP